MDTTHLRYSTNICISGLTASGKTTHAHLLAGEFGLTYVSGSQIQLNFLGVSPIQSKDFWITHDAKALWDTEQFQRIDSELLAIENRSTGCVFDTSTMPWRHQQPAFCIWLESTLASRVTKSIISHRGRSQFGISEYPRKISEKDDATIKLYNDLYKINIGMDPSRFDMIIDISGLIEKPTLGASLSSIAVAHKFIRSATALCLTGNESYKNELLAAVEQHPNILKKCTLLNIRT